MPEMHFWESEQTHPQITQLSSEAKLELQTSFKHSFSHCMRHPFLSATEIRQTQFDRVKYLVELAYKDIPVYREKYRAVGFTPHDLQSWDDFAHLPIITKDELIDAFPDRCIHPSFVAQELFSTRSSGSSGRTILIRVNLQAILTDTIQGVRQIALQSGLQYCPDHLLVYIYTVPWWVDSIGNNFPTAFISSILPTMRVSQHLRELNPQIISCYPSNLEALLPYAHEFTTPNLYLAVTHSESSSKCARAAWSKVLGVPVLDEYSSEEATRIALELPCGHYHVCEDTVHLDVLDPQTFQPQIPGQPGIAVITNLLNEAMPFIRYVQGDMVTRPIEQSPCLVQWSQLSSIDGRLNDSFINKDGRIIAAGTILDITYRWMFDFDLHIKEFELVQEKEDRVYAQFVPGADVSELQLRASIQHLEDLLAVCLEHPVHVVAEVTTEFPRRTGKKRPIRREFRR